MSIENEDGLWGYCDKNGNEVIPFKYNIARSFDGAYAPVEREDGKWGIIDKKGNTVVPFN